MGVAAEGLFLEVCAASFIPNKTQQQNCISRAVDEYTELLDFLRESWYTEDIIEIAVRNNEKMRRKLKKGPWVPPPPPEAFGFGPNGAAPPLRADNDKDWLDVIRLALLDRRVVRLFKGAELLDEETGKPKGKKHLVAATVDPSLLMLKAREYLEGWSSQRVGRAASASSSSSSSSDNALELLPPEALAYAHGHDRRCLGIAKKSLGGKTHIPSEKNTAAPKVSLGRKNRAALYHVMVFVTAYLYKAGWNFPKPAISLAILRLVMQDKLFVPWVLCHCCGNGEFCVSSFPLHKRVFFSLPLLFSFYLPLTFRLEKKTNKKKNTAKTKHRLTLPT